MKLDATHDPELSSWVDSANEPGCEFPIQNLPFGIFKRKNLRESPRGGVAIGDQILDLAVLGIKTGPSLNGIAGMGRAAWKKPEPRYERGYGWMFTRHIKQANEGCDFDFLETGFGAPVAEPSIY